MKKVGQSFKQICPTVFLLPPTSNKFENRFKKLTGSAFSNVNRANLHSYSTQVRSNSTTKSQEFTVSLYYNSAYIIFFISTMALLGCLLRMLRIFRISSCLFSHIFFGAFSAGKRCKTLSSTVWQ